MSEAVIVNYFSPEYYRSILETRLVATYDNSVADRERHDAIMVEIRKLPLEKRLEMYKSIYGREDYGTSYPER